MLPALPRTFGRLTDVLASSLGSIIGTDNRLGFAKAHTVVNVLVDGLGAHNLKAAGGHATFLNAALARSKPISCGFPSTTATSITSFATGLWAGEHSIVGYKTFDRALGREANLLTGWDAQQLPNEWQPHTTLAESAGAAGIDAVFIGPAAYQGSGFTEATMRGARYLAGKSIADRIDVVLDLLAKRQDPRLVYLYIPELDQTAHSVGVESRAWLNLVEELDGQIKRLSAALGKGQALLLTADHGVVDVPLEAQIYLDELSVNWQDVVCVAGDPRVNYIYLADPLQGHAFEKQLQAVFESAVPGAVAVFTKQAAIDAGLFGPRVSDSAMSRLPDVFALGVKKVALYQRSFAPAYSLKMVGQHGGLSQQELAIPLLGWGAFAD